MSNRPFQGLNPVTALVIVPETYEAFVFPAPPCVPPSITLEPVNQSVRTGEDASFTITADGTAPLSYQWSVSVNAGVDWNPVTNDEIYSGATTAELTISPTSDEMDENEYRCEASNGCGAATSDAATLNVRPLPNATGEVSWTYIPAGGTMTVLSAGAMFDSGTVTWTFPISSGFLGGSFDSIRVRLYDADNNLLSTSSRNPVFNAPNITVAMGVADHGVLDILPASPAALNGSTTSPLNFTS